MTCCKCHAFKTFLSNVKIRCMEHSLHLVAKDFVQTIALGFASTTMKHDNAGLDTNGDHNSDDEAFDLGDSLGKANALVKQVSPFPALPKHFSNCYRFVSHHRQERFSVTCASKSGSHHLNLCYGFVLDGDCSTSF